MTKILMVCLGNICRSPLAEGILESKLDASKFTVDSAGTSSHHQGSLPDPRSIEVAQKNGLDISNQRSRPFVKKDFKTFDYIYVMDTHNYNDVLEKADTEEECNKVSLILNTLYPRENRSVPDPYYDALEGFDKVYEMLDQSCTLIAEKLKSS